ncbi:hypothetical protein CFC21_096787 [Triticum aestivum]|uniref:Uncharacterized protein n=2 Tax=Triticum aestivum TaxID=4565 RepID=A0A3B6RFI3_WHEAT|nr:hypothetical protein CFC21_096787 [Triticum aestivum]
MATGPEIFRPLAVTGDVVEAPALLIATGKDQLVDPVIWGDEERMKRELMAWAKAVASMALNGSVDSSSPLSMGRRQRSQGASRLQLSI